MSFFLFFFFVCFFCGRGGGEGEWRLSPEAEIFVKD